MAAWQGVTTNEEGRLIGLELDRNRLAGIIPPQLGDLDALKQPSQRMNRLEGDISPELGKPPELGKLDALKTLNLFDYKLAGNIPPALAH